MADLANQASLQEPRWFRLCPVSLAGSRAKRAAPGTVKQHAQVNNWPCRVHGRSGCFCVPGFLFYVNHPEHVCINLLMMHLWSIDFRQKWFLSPKIRAGLTCRLVTGCIKRARRRLIAELSPPSLQGLSWRPPEGPGSEHGGRHERPSWLWDPVNTLPPGELQGLPGLVHPSLCDRRPKECLLCPLPHLVPSSRSCGHPTPLGSCDWRLAQPHLQVVSKSQAERWSARKEAGILSGNVCPSEVAFSMLFRKPQVPPALTLHLLPKERRRRKPCYWVENPGKAISYGWKASWT